MVVRRSSLAFLLVLVGAGGCAGGGSTTEQPGDDAGGGVDANGPLGNQDASVPPHDAALPTEAGGGGNNDAGAKQPCTHNQDCTGPNICSGNNGLACLGGFCVPTGKPMNCDDGVACTDDSCDANANACTHNANDATCPNGSYCDKTLNCVQQLPCQPCDSVCDRLNTSACDGLWSCDAQKQYCVHAPKPCADRPNASTACSASSSAAACTWTCASGFVDLNKDVNAPAGQTSDGCECKITDAVDKPGYPTFVDGNCDGIIGNASAAIFVDTVSGNDSNAGTMASPKKTVQAGINAAAAATPVKDVYVSLGTYAEAVVLADGVSVYGGYDAAHGWSRALANVTLIDSTTNVGVLAQGLQKASEVQLMSITSANAAVTSITGDGTSSYGMRVVNSPGGVTVRGCNITAGKGAAASQVPRNGSDGQGGGGGGNANGTSSGPRGDSACLAYGGAGGAGVSGTTPGHQGDPGTQVANGGTAGQGGPGGAAGSCGGVSSGDGSAPQTNPTSGGKGDPRSNGNAGASFGGLDSSGAYVPPVGGDGLTDGIPGGGGGGGGSGGGSAHGTSLFCTDCTSINGGAGGGGGGGGCGGKAGKGGRGGGGSFAIAMVGSTVRVDASKMTTARGGDGGPGGNGGNGGGGGQPGSGAGGQSDSSHCSSRSGGNGGAGATGGPGGHGGGGAGGTAGPSVCIVYKGTSPTTTSTQCSSAGPGNPGPGGTNGVTAAQNGAPGIQSDLQAAQ